MVNIDIYDAFEQSAQATKDYAYSKGCEITTMGKAYEAYKNELDIGKITDNTYYVVDCDGKSYEK